MGKSVEHYCDICGQLLYHSTHSTVVKIGEERWWWRGSYNRPSEVEICSSCVDVITYLNEERKDLIAKIRKKLHGKSPAYQERNKPKPFTKQWIARRLNPNKSTKGKG